MLKEENSKLKAQNKVIVENNLQSISKLNKENIELQHEISSFLNCDVCDKAFENKAAFLIHIENHLKNKYSLHASEKVRCKTCDKLFRSKDDLAKHIRAKHQSQLSKELMLQRETNLLNKIHVQSFQIHKSLGTLKSAEYSKNGKCKCKGNCEIKHAKFRWTEGTYQNYSLR